MAVQDMELSAFLQTFSDPLHHRKPESSNSQWVFWNKDEGSQNNSSSADVATNRMIYDKIKSAFSFGGILVCRFILQFWAPVTIGGRRLLSTSGQPFSVNNIDNDLAKYRLRSLEYQYNIDESNKLNIEQHPAMIISGAASSAFLNRFMVVVNDEELMERHALEYGVKASYMLPICCPSQSSSCCVGVVEASKDFSADGLFILPQIERVLERVGLSVFRVQERIPYKISQGKKYHQYLKHWKKERNKLFEEYQAHSKSKCKTAPIPLSRQAIEQQFGNTMKEAAKNLSVSLSTLKRKCHGYGISEWQGPSLEKRKVNVSSNNQRDKNEEDNGAIQDPSAANKNENTLNIKAEWEDDIIKFHLNISQATFVTVEKEIGIQFNLTMGTYKLKYLDEDGDWILLKSDQDMSNCFKSLRKLDRTHVRLRVQQSTQPIPGTTGSYEIYHS